MELSTKTLATSCTRCGNPFSDEELESPQMDDDNDPICDECYHDNYEFTCCCCQEYGHVDDQHKLLVVFEECDSSGGATRTVSPGIYKTAAGTYYGGPLIGSGYLCGDRLERIADVNPGMDGNGYPCGHLCADCQANVLAQFKAVCSECKTESASCLKVKVAHWHDRECTDYRWSRVKVLCAACRDKSHQWKIHPSCA